MYIKQINQKQALELAVKGMDIMVMEPNKADPQLWTDYSPLMLQDMLSGCMFFQMDMAAGPSSEEDKKKLDVGKMQALRKAGWSNKKIAEEMGVSEGTVWNRLHPKGGKDIETETNKKRN